MQYENYRIVYLQEQLKTLDLAYFERLAENPQTLKPTTHDALCRSLYRYRKPYSF
jgi:hypothetical protein